jgi:hypothetical protein
VLIADKVLAIAATVGREQFDNLAWARDFARAAASALGKPAVRIDTQAMTVAY